MTTRRIIAPQAGRQHDFHMCDADIAIYGGSAGGGKTWALLYEPLCHMHRTHFGAVVFRRTYPQITVQGGMWDGSREIYTLYRDPVTNVAPVPKAGSLTWEFPRGCSVSFRHMQTDDAADDYQGAQIPLICFDQLEQFEERQFFTMLSRNRSMCGVRPYVRATANPKPCWLADFLSWWLAPDGYADVNKIGARRWFIRDGASLQWADTRAELLAKYGKDVRPLSVVFIPASVYDNRELLRVNPSYLANLMALPSTERARLLGDRVRGGNWTVTPGGSHFKREWFEVVPQAPASPRSIRRYWDMAATPPDLATGNGSPDYTVGAKVAFLDGVWYIVDIRRDRLSPKSARDLVWQTTVIDGVSVPARMECEGGASGKSMIDLYAREVFAGYAFKGVHPSGSKEVRAQPLSAAAESGNVKLVAGEWNKAFLDEAESFPHGKHDDQVDAVAGAMDDIRRSLGGQMVYLGGQAQPLDNIRRQLDNTIRQQFQAITDPTERLEAADILRKAGFNV